MSALECQAILVRLSKVSRNLFTFRTVESPERAKTPDQPLLKQHKRHYHTVAIATFSHQDPPASVALRSLAEADTTCHNRFVFPSPTAFPDIPRHRFHRQIRQNIGYLAPAPIPTPVFGPRRPGTVMQPVATRQRGHPSRRDGLTAPCSSWLVLLGHPSYIEVKTKYRIFDQKSACQYPYKKVLGIPAPE